MLLANTFEWGIALHGLHSEHDRAATDAEKSTHTRALIRKIARQAGKDYVLFPHSAVDGGAVRSRQTPRRTCYAMCGRMW